MVKCGRKASIGKKPLKKQSKFGIGKLLGNLPFSLEIAFSYLASKFTVGL